jgi:hypothetical protein
MECLATFDTTHMALVFEKACRASGLPARIVPVPRELSASCGLACTYPCDQEEAVITLCLNQKIETAGLHHL